MFSTRRGVIMDWVANNKIWKPPTNDKKKNKDTGGGDDIDITIVNQMLNQNQTDEFSFDNDDCGGDDGGDE